MTAQIIDGKKIAADIKEEIKKEITKRKVDGLSNPGLATLLIGDDPASQSYVKGKHAACELVGIQSFGYELPADIPQKEIEMLIKQLNKDENIHGILVQLPMPNHLDEEKILGLVSLEKDVDGFHPVNIGRLAQKGREPLFTPATPTGIIALIKTVLNDLAGKKAVVLGRSNIVGLPVSLLLLEQNATVTICHSRTNDLVKEIGQADILVAAIGKPEFVKGQWIKSGSIVIDVGVNRVDDESRKRGYRLVGDVEFDKALEVASAITPVPGGVGPMTIAMLLNNTLVAAKRSV